MNTSASIATFFLAAAATLLLGGGCTHIRPPEYITVQRPEQELRFDYEEYHRLLQEHVDDSGLVDYRSLAKNSISMDRFYSKIAAVSPESHPHLFPDGNHRLAYWINAYNATVIHGVLSHYPINSVSDVEAPAFLFFFPDRSGFFFFQRFSYGGRRLSLYALENDVIRTRFTDPRYHFALNCASLSCPELPRIPFTPDTLDRRLDEEAREFIGDREHVRYNQETNVLHLSAIFSWYADDFLNWVAKHHPGAPVSLSSYILHYLPPQTAAKLEANLDTATVKFLEYDWTLNDQRRHIDN